MYQNSLCQCKSLLCFPGIFASHGLIASTECLEETLVKAELLLFYCQRIAPGCPKVPQRKLLCFFKLEVFRDEKNPFVHSFFYFHLQIRKIKFDGWKARLASQRFSKGSQPSVSSFHCFSMHCAVEGVECNPKKKDLIAFILQYNVM